MRRAKIAIGIAVVVTLATVVVWQATGGDYYTKFQVVEEIESETDPDDPLAAAGFYDGDSSTEVVTRDEFRFGLLPTPEGVFDKHAVSVASISGPVWLGAIGFAWWARRKEKRSKSK
jgi:hypothetical protein